jgi:hypothetical protein
MSKFEDQMIADDLKKMPPVEVAREIRYRVESLNDFIRAASLAEIDVEYMIKEHETYKELVVWVSQPL